MLSYPAINPIAFRLGPLSVHWYGLMYLVGFLAAWGLLSQRAAMSCFNFNKEHVSDMIFYAALGVIVGGRLGYMLFYDVDDMLHHPAHIFLIWQGGMSFHGGLIGVIVAMWFYAHKIHRSLLTLTDFIAPVVPVGLAAGRVGNFINGELWGRVTEMPWGMVFPHAGNLPRHPSQLYEFLLEGVMLFILLWWFAKSVRPTGAISGLFLMWYGCFRFLIEFFREPDAQMGFVAFGWMTKGQVLSLPMIVLGAVMVIWAYSKGRVTLCKCI